MSFPETKIPPLEDVKKHFKLFDYIDGERIPPTIDMKAFVHNPNTGEKIAPQMATSNENIERALQTAQRLHESGEWANTSPEKRAEILDKAGDHLMSLVPMIAAVESYNTGIVFSTTSFVNAIVWLAFKAAAGVLKSGYAVTKVPGPHGDVEVLRKP
jgi:acyl-CoA reductase-like NAD-dependent aldehyde dehydrogenase